MVLKQHVPISGDGSHSADHVPSLRSQISADAHWARVCHLRSQLLDIHSHRACSIKPKPWVVRRCGVSRLASGKKLVEDFMQRQCSVVNVTEPGARTGPCSTGKEQAEFCLFGS